ncbi:MAG: hypothetical protein CL833_12335 [Crocinitomicaceae bacterium]|nr:hypothetical protein [Crocinitomicaceae bacterium]
MKRTRVITHFPLLFLCFSTIVYGQKPAVEKSYAMFKKEYYGGISFNTNGWGLSFYSTRHKTAVVKRLITVDFNVVKHPKEYKIYNPLDDNSKSYVFGKLNGFATLDVGLGKKKIFFEKLRSKGLQLSANWSVGPSLGLVKPVYLEILKFNGIEVVGIAEEKYDPESHNLTNIYGRAPNLRGLGEMRFAPGGFAKFGLNFEFSSEREGLKALELGAKVNVYPWEIPIMTAIDNKFIFTELYICLQFGKKYI